MERAPARFHAFCENAPSIEHLLFIGLGLKVRTCSVLQLSALSQLREIAASDSQEQ